MIRFRHVVEPSSSANQLILRSARLLFRQAFPDEPEGIDRIVRMLKNRARLDFEPILLVSLDRKGQLTGLCFVFYFNEIKFGYLQYLASDPRQSQRGIGGALYEALREFLAAKGARGLLLDIPPVDADKLDDVSRLAVNRKRWRFYERYGARIVDGTEWDITPNPRNAYFLTTLVFDPLGRVPKLHRATARHAVRRILVAQYGYHGGDKFVEQIVNSFRDDPVRLRAPTRMSPPQLPPILERIRPIKIVVSDAHIIHHLKEKGYVERPVRVRQILRGLETIATERVPVKHFPDRHILAVHDPKLVSYLRNACSRLDETAIIYPEVFPIRRPDRAPKALEDRAGYFCADTFTPLTRHAWTAARRAVDVALTAAELVALGERFAYAICRPPGHHAERRIYGGFCFLNNSAIAANYLAAGGERVALLDIDYHHGNGGQDIFYQRRDVFTLSIHGDPRHAYPNFSGYSDERGEGVGEGYNRNWPLKPPVDDARYLRVLEHILRSILRFKPSYLVVSLGFDIMKGDPTGSFEISPTGLKSIAEGLGQLQLPTLIVQEGGYSVRNLRIGARSFFSALAEYWFRNGPTMSR